MKKAENIEKIHKEFIEGNYLDNKSQIEDYLEKNKNNKDKLYFLLHSYYHQVIFMDDLIKKENIEKHFFIENYMLKQFLHDIWTSIKWNTNENL